METKEVIGGYAILEASSLKEAIALTERFMLSDSAGRGRDGAAAHIISTGRDLTLLSRYG